MAHLKEAGIPNMIYYPTPQHALPVFRDEPHYGETFRNADDYCARTFSLPMHPYLEQAERRQIIDAGIGGAVMAEKAYFVHPSSYVDEGCDIGAGTKIWHFSHIMSGCTIGERCNIGQNVVISPGVRLGTAARSRTMSPSIPVWSVRTACSLAPPVFLPTSSIPGLLSSARANTVGRW